MQSIRRRIQDYLEAPVSIEAIAEGARRDYEFVAVTDGTTAAINVSKDEEENSSPTSRLPNTRRTTSRSWPTSRPRTASTSG